MGVETFMTDMEQSVTKNGLEERNSGTTTRTGCTKMTPAIAGSVMRRRGSWRRSLPKSAKITPEEIKGGGYYWGPDRP